MKTTAMKTFFRTIRFALAALALQASLISYGFDVSIVYPTNDWPNPSYERTVPSGEIVSLLESSFTNLTDSSLSLVLSDGMDCILENLISEEKFHVRIGVGNSMEQAREMMLTHFSMCSAIQPFPRLTLEGGELGDRAYKGWGTNAVNAASFVRNNVFVDLFADEESATVVPLAIYLDEAILCVSNMDRFDTPLRSSPPSGSPAPESFQAMRVFSSGSKEPSDSSPPAPEPAFQTMRVFSSDLEEEQ